MKAIRQRINSHVVYGALAAVLLLGLMVCPGRAQTINATLVALGHGLEYYSRYYGIGIFSGVLKMDIDGEIHDGYCIDMYTEIGFGSVLLANGPLSDDIRGDIDWCAVNHILNNYTGVDDLEASAIQSSIWFLVTEPFGPYTDLTGSEKYQFMTDPDTDPLYDAYRGGANPSEVRARAFEMLDSVPRDAFGVCLSRFPDSIDLQPDEAGLKIPLNQPFSLTATVFDQHGEPLPDVAVSFDVDNGSLDVIMGITDLNGMVTVQFTPTDTPGSATVFAWAEGQYGSLLFDENQIIQSVTTITTLPFSIGDQSVVAWEEGGCGDACEGCGHGFWKNHPLAWVGYQLLDTLGDVFILPAEIDEALGQDTLYEALRYHGGPDFVDAAQNLFKQAVASLLNAAHPEVDFQFSEEDVILSVEGALATGDRDIVLDLAEMLDAENNQGCDVNTGCDKKPKKNKQHGAKKDKEQKHQEKPYDKKDGNKGKEKHRGGRGRR